MFNQPDSRPDFSKLDVAITEWWKENQIFEKSVSQREGAESYIFYDGPPFMSGMPHYATLLSSLPKDVIPRYQSMKGKYVERLWGWDTHGLPIENKVEDQLKLQGRRAILDYGLEGFIEKCYEWNRVGIENWRWYIDKIGRWADIDNAYRTLDQDYMESIWWAFKQMWDKGLIYKGRRVSMFSTDSSTPVSDFEVSMDPDNYRETKDIAIAVKFQLKDDSVAKLAVEGPVFAVAWTTTPWTIPANFALTVNPEATYLLAEVDGSKVIFAKDLLDNVQERVGAEKGIDVVKELTGKQLEGLAYLPPYDFFSANENDHHIYLSDAVTTTDGTGILHVSPGFGEVDFELGEELGLSFHQSVDDQGNMTVGPWKGTYLRDANSQITKDLLETGKLLFKHSYRHRLPYYRYENPLIYKAQENYFVNIQKLKQQLIKSNEDINWIPEHFKHGRFEYILENAPDWSISRSRFWGTAMPLWETEDGTQMVVGSRDELMELVNASDNDLQIKKIVLEEHADCDYSLEECSTDIDGFLNDPTETDLIYGSTQPMLSELRNKYFGETETESRTKPIKAGEQRPYYLVNGKPLDLHRPYIDEISFIKDGKTFKRTEFTLDVWMDSGAMPFAQFHYPAQNKEKFEHNFPGDFIAEYTGQIRAWFYVLHVMANALFDKPAFKNVLVTGVLAGTDGRKMSKSFGNYPDPKLTLEKYGGEALRLYFLGSTIMTGNDINFSEEELKLQLREFSIPLWNIYKYFVTYANMHEWVPKEEYAYNKRNVWNDEHPWNHIPIDSPGNELDAWMLTILQNHIGEVTAFMDAYELPKAVKSLKVLLDEISRWYIRRSRERFAAGEDMALTVLYYVLIEFCKLAAPIAPFTTEEIYRNLVVAQFSDMPYSVHLTDYPVVDVAFVDEYTRLIKEMEIVRQTAELGQMIRANNGLKVRQPLSRLEIELSTEHDLAGDLIVDWMKQIIADELNVKEVVEVPQISASTTVLTAENSKIGIKVGLETTLTTELEEEGLVREIVRQVQNLRKQMKLEMGEEIKFTYSAPAELTGIMQKYEQEIMEGISATQMDSGDTKDQVKINEYNLGVSITT